MTVYHRYIATYRHEREAAMKSTISGIRPVAPIAIIDRELRAQNSSLDAFCREFSVSASHVSAVLDEQTRDERVMLALADVLGVSIESLQRA